jgi:hypothetical protein
MQDLFSQFIIKLYELDKTKIKGLLIDMLLFKRKKILKEGISTFFQ